MNTENNSSVVTPFADAPAPVEAPAAPAAPPAPVEVPKEVPCVAAERGHRSCHCGGRYCLPRE